MSTQLTEITKFDKDTVNLIKTLIPSAHAESLSLMLQEKKEMERAYKALEKDIKQVRADFSETATELEEFKRNLEEIKIREKDVKTKETELVTRETQISFRESERNHSDEIAQIRLDCANQKTDLLTATMSTVFKPSSVRKTVHENIPMVQGLYNQQYDSNSNLTKYTKEGEEIVNVESKTTTSESEE